MTRNRRRYRPKPMAVPQYATDLAQDEIEQVDQEFGSASFTLYGIEFTCRPINSLMLSHVMRMQGVRGDDVRSIAFIAEFFELILGQRQYRELLELSMEHGITNNQLKDLLENVIQAMTDRPTGRRSVSSGGSPTMNSTSGENSVSQVMLRLHGRPDLQRAVQMAREPRTG